MPMKHCVYIFVACLLWATPVLAQDTFKVFYEKVDALTKEIEKTKREAEITKNPLNNEIKELKIEKSFFSTILGLQSTGYSIFFGVLAIIIATIFVVNYFWNSSSLKMEYEGKAENLKQYFDEEINIQNIRNNELKEVYQKITENLEIKYEQKSNDLQSNFSQKMEELKKINDEKINEMKNIFEEQSKKNIDFEYDLLISSATIKMLVTEIVEDANIKFSYYLSASLYQAKAVKLKDKKGFGKIKTSIVCAYNILHDNLGNKDFLNKIVKNKQELFLELEELLKIKQEDIKSLTRKIMGVIEEHCQEMPQTEQTEV